MTVPSKIDRSVWVGFLQLDEYDESISVHDEVDRQVSALLAGFLGGALPDEPSIDFELDRYAGVMGLTRAPLTGIVARIRWLHYPVPEAPATPPTPGDPVPTVTSVYSNKEALGHGRHDRQALLVQRAKAPPSFGGFVVDVVLDSNSEELEALRVHLPTVASVPWRESH